MIACTDYNIFLLPTRSPKFLFRLYDIIFSCSNVVRRFAFICNKFQGLLVISFTFSKVFYMLKQKDFFFDLFFKLWC